MYAASNQLLEFHAVVFGNGREANVQLVFVIFGADVKGRTRFRQ